MTESKRCRQRRDRTEKNVHDAILDLHFLRFLPQRRADGNRRIHSIGRIDGKLHIVTATGNFFVFIIDNVSRRLNLAGRVVSGSDNLRTGGTKKQTEKFHGHHRDGEEYCNFVFFSHRLIRLWRKIITHSVLLFFYFHPPLYPGEVPRNRGGGVLNTAFVGYFLIAQPNTSPTAFDIRSKTETGFDAVYTPKKSESLSLAHRSLALI